MCPHKDTNCLFICSDFAFKLKKTKKVRCIHACTSNDLNVNLTGTGDQGQEILGAYDTAHPGLVVMAQSGRLRLRRSITPFYHVYSHLR